MALTEIQPTLPPEGAFTDPELNFIDESPRGFFPENQDSNWGWKRKVFTDNIQVAFDQLNLIFSEIFPQSSQEFLDEWEEAVGLPQNPTNKTLAHRRSMVVNRLRGGPFTRKQRREIVESYIAATFGDPILLLPPGHPLAIGGSPLYNEFGDIKQLYMISEDLVVNALPNPSFEINTTGWGAHNSATVSRDTVEHYDGVASAKVITGNAGNFEGIYTTQNIPTQAGTVWSASAFVKGSGTVFMLLRGFDSSNAIVDQVGTSTITLSSSWQRLTATSNPWPAGVVKMDMVIITNPQQAVTFYVDAAQLEQSSGASPYFNIPGFRYTVRIQTGMAIDQLGLERDLRWFTPAGILPVFDYAWTGKFPTESGTGVDSIGGRRIAVQDIATALESVMYRGTDTGVGADIGKIGIPRTETGTGVEGTVTIKAVLADIEVGVGGEVSWVGPKRPVFVQESITGVDEVASLPEILIDDFNRSDGPLV